MNTSTHWTGNHTLDIATSPETIWHQFADVATWQAWNAGIEEIRIDGPFQKGTEIHMKPPGQDAFVSCLVEVKKNERFVDETRVGDLVVVVSHVLESLGDGRTRVTYAIDARGPHAEHVGPAISADFPDVLKALAARVATRAT